LRFGDGRRHAFTSPNEFGHAHVHATASGAETLLRFREGADVDTHSIASRPYLARPTASHIVFMYLGRRGLGRYTLELAQAVRSLPSMRPTFVVSEQNEIIENIAHSARDIVKLPTPRMQPPQPQPSTLGGLAIRFLASWSTRGLAPSSI
jgi:hypothetical protein